MSPFNTDLSLTAPELAVLAGFFPFALAFFSPKLSLAAFMSLLMIGLFGLIFVLFVSYGFTDQLVQDCASHGTGFLSCWISISDSIVALMIFLAALVVLGMILLATDLFSVFRHHRRADRHRLV